jgi:hypothetical protein
MFIISGTSTRQPHETRCFVFESITIAPVIAEKLKDQGVEVEILDQPRDVTGCSRNLSGRTGPTC